MRKLLLAVLAATAAGAIAAYAGSSTVNYASSGSAPFRTTTDGSSNNLTNMTIWDSAAGANGLAVSAAGAAKVDGSAVTQPISGLVTANPGTAANWGIAATGVAGPANGIFNLGAVTTAAPTYTTGTANALSLDTAGGLRVSVIAGGGTGGTSSNFGSTFPGIGTAAGAQYLTSPPTLTTGQMVALQTTVNGSLHTTVDNTNANGQATKAASAPVALASDQSVADPCTFQAKTNVAISTAAGTTAVVTGVSAKKIYVCSLVLIAPSAVSVSLAEGSSATCGTSAQAAVIGVATSGTALNGMALTANGGLTLGNGNGTVAATATATNYLCLFQSGTAQLAGNLTYVQQ